MAKNKKPTRDEQGKADMEKMQKRVENLLPDKADIPASISIQQAEELKARVRELETQLAQQTSAGSGNAHEVVIEPIHAKSIKNQKSRFNWPIRSWQSLTPSQLSPQADLAGQQAQTVASPDRNKEQPANRGKLTLWQRLVEPVATITEAGERRQASLVSALLLVFVIAASIGPFAEAYVLNDPTSARILVGMDIGFGIAYILSRTKGYRLAVPFLTVALAAWPILSVALTKNYSSTGLLTIFVFDILIIILSGTLASFRTTLFLSVANFLGILLLPVLIPSIQFGNIIIPLIFNGLVSALILVLTRHRNQVEKDRLLEVTKINNTLQASNAALDARTHDLELAAEVSSTIAEKVENLTAMLTDATEMIRSRFSLYYTQVYLLDPSGQTITLHAGTGDAGRQLLQRGHHLLVSSSSLNGRAVSEKRPVIVADTQKSGTFLPNPLLPNTRSEMAIPLLVGDKVLGVLDMQSEIPEALNEDNLAAFQVLAGQLSVAIQNATLFAQSEEARKQVEANVREIATDGWKDFLNGNDRGEKIGYVFDQNKVKPMEPKSKARSENTLSMPITVTGATVGSIEVAEDEREWTTSEMQIIQSTAEKLSQHIEGLRLLAQAEKYRHEAEQNTRRLTREGWEDYLQTRHSLITGYSFIPNEIKLENAEVVIDSSSALNLPLKIRDETVGEFVIQGLGGSNDSESISLANAVVERLGAHIEALRLSSQTEQALAATQEFAQREQSLRQITSAVRGSTDPATILRTAARELGTLLGRKTVIRLAATAENTGNKSVIPAESTNADGGNK